MNHKFPLGTRQPVAVSHKPDGGQQRRELPAIVTTPARRKSEGDKSLRTYAEVQAMPVAKPFAPPMPSPEMILQQLNHAVVFIDAELRITMTNAAARRMARMEPQGTTIDLAPVVWGTMLDTDGHAVPPSDWPWAKAMRGESIIQQQCRLLHANASYDILFSAVPSIAANGESNGAIATFTDITQPNRRAQLLREQAVRRERIRMAEDMHDTFCQRLNAVVLQLQAAQDCIPSDHQSALYHLKVAHAVTRESLADARRTMWTLCHESLGDVDAAFALGEIAKRVMRGTPISLDLSVPQHRRHIPPPVGLELLRIGEEALSNVVKHSQATRVSLELAYKRHNLYLSVEDDGCGFLFTHCRDRQSGFGLTSMRERADRLGGRVSVASELGKGTRVTAIIPWPAAAAA